MYDAPLSTAAAMILSSLGSAFTAPAAVSFPGMRRSMVGRSSIAKRRISSSESPNHNPLAILHLRKEGSNFLAEFCERYLSNAHYLVPFDKDMLLTRRGTVVASPLPFDHPNRPHARHFVGQSRFVYDLDHFIDILVRLGLFLRQAAVTLGARDDPAGLELLVDASAGRFLDGGSSAHGTAGAMAGRAEGLVHAPLLAHQDPAGPTHVAGNDHCLADRTVMCWDFR